MIISKQELTDRVRHFSWIYEKYSGFLQKDEIKAFKGVGLSKSSLDKINKSVDHFFEKKFPETAAMKIGSAFHCLVLEPHKFHDQFINAPDIDRRTTAGKAQYKEFEEEHEKKTIIPSADWEMIHLMCQSLESNDVASEMLAPYAGEVEETMMWNDPELGTLMKGRGDFRNKEQKIIIDLKSTMDASEDKIEKDMWSNDLRYHVQAAIYTDAVRTLTGDSSWKFHFIFVEKKPPYGVQIANISEAGLDVGRFQYHSNVLYLLDWLEKARESLDKDKPPPTTYESKVIDLQPPAWLLQKIKKQIRSRGL